MKRDDLVSLAVSVGAPLLGGQLMGLISYKGIQGWYHRLKKPRWTPPKWLFATAWPVLYVGQGVSAWLVWKDKSIKGNKKNVPLALYGAQLILNLLWQPIMFKMHRPDLALVDSSLMLGVATAATASMATVVKGAGNKATVASLMGVYVAWLGFATALNAKIYKDNPDADKIDDTPLPPAEQVKSLKAQ
jgi:tryptophan-rich sensory protein